MRVLVVEPGPAFSVADVCRGWSKGLKQTGCEVVTLNLGDRLNFYASAHCRKGRRWVPAFSGQEAARVAAKGIEVACYEWWPDVVVYVMGSVIPPETFWITSQRHTTVLVHTESPYEDDRQIERAPWVDVNIVNDPTNLDRFQAAAPNTHYIPHAYDPDIHSPGEIEEDLRSDFAFVGTGYPSRIAFFERVGWEGIDIALAGNWQALGEDSPLRAHVTHEIEMCVDNTDAVRLYRATKASANLYRRESERPELEQGWAMGPREVELAATGTFFLTEPRGENREVLPMVPTFEGPEYFESQLRTWLADDVARAEVARAAKCAVLDRTFEHNARRLLSILA